MIEKIGDKCGRNRQARQPYKHMIPHSGIAGFRIPDVRGFDLLELELWDTGCRLFKLVGI